MKVWRRTRQTSHLFQVSSSSVSGYMSTCLTSAIRSFYMHTFLTKWCWSGLTVLSRHSVETLSEKWAGIQLVRNTRPQSSQLAVPLFTDPGPKKGISALANLQFKKKNSRKIIHRILPQILACEEKGTTTIEHLTVGRPGQHTRVAVIWKVFCNCHLPRSRPSSSWTYKYKYWTTTYL